LTVHVGENRPLPVGTTPVFAHSRWIIGPVVGHHRENDRIPYVVLIPYPFPADHAAEIAPTVKVENDRFPLQIVQPDAAPLADRQEIEGRGALADTKADGSRTDVLSVGILVEMTAADEGQDKTQRQQ